MSFFNWLRSQETNDQCKLKDLQTQLNTLNDYAVYNVKEMVSDGTIITHMTRQRKRSVTFYCKKIWLKKHPATFIFETVYKDFRDAIEGS